MEVYLRFLDLLVFLLERWYLFLVGILEWVGIFLGDRFLNSILVMKILVIKFRKKKERKKINIFMRILIFRFGGEE